MMKIGAQLFTVRMFIQTREDFQETIRRIADMGYHYVQLSGMGNEITAEFAKEVCDKYGVKIVLTHVNADRILYDTETLIKEHKVMGCQYIGLGCMPEKYHDSEWIARFVKDFQKPARKIKEAGMLLMYHNHDLEFEKVNGKFLMEILLENFAPDELGITLDTYWVQTAGADVIEWVERCKGRIPCAHLKDRMVLPGREEVMAPVMEGAMNFRGILKALEKSGCQYALVEQDSCMQSPFLCLKKSYENLSSLGYC